MMAPMAIRLDKIESEWLGNAREALKVGCVGFEHTFLCWLMESSGVNWSSQFSHQIHKKVKVGSSGQSKDTLHCSGNKGPAWDGRWV
jgi:hypothetical protein